jgi:nucleotide-binding universal stress UspA family protein
MRRKADRLSGGMTMPGKGPADTPTIIIGTDSSGTSWDAFWWACAEARRLGGRAIAVIIGPRPTCHHRADAPAGSAVAAYEATDVAAIGHSLAEMLREAADVDLTVIHTPGDPITELLRVAGEVHADMIVVGRSPDARHRRAGPSWPRLVSRQRESVIVVVPEQCKRVAE